MAFFIINFIFSTLSFVSYYVSRLIFFTIAHLLVLFIHGFKSSGESTLGALQQVLEVIKSVFVYLLQLILDAAGAVVSTLFDYLKDGVIGTGSVVTSAVGDLIEKTKNSLDGAMEFSGAFEGVPGTVSQMVMDLWNNCKDALGYVTENA